MAMKRSSQPRSGIQNRARLLQAPQWTRFPWLVHGFSTRAGGVSSFAHSRTHRNGDLNLAKVPWDSVGNVHENRRRLLAQLRADQMQLVLLNQIHSDLIRVLDGSNAASGLTAEGPLSGDGLTTDRPGLLLSVLVADCLPILLVDRKQRVVAALHCGWRGTARRLAQKGVGLMRLRFGSRERDLQAAIGPGIRACCYEVGADVVEEFETQFREADKFFLTRTHALTPMEIKHSLLFTHSPEAVGPSRNEKVYLDLVKANLQQLQEAGLSESSIHAESPCTRCHPEQFFSYRRDGPRAGRMMGVIGIRAG